MLILVIQMILVILAIHHYECVCFKFQFWAIEEQTHLTFLFISTHIFTNVYIQFFLAGMMFLRE